MEMNRTLEMRDGKVFTQIVQTETFDLDACQDILDRLQVQLGGKQREVDSDVATITETENEMKKSRISKQEIEKVKKMMKLGMNLEQMDQIKSRLKQNREMLETMKKDKAQLEEFLEKHGKIRRDEVGNTKVITEEKAKDSDIQ